MTGQLPGGMDPGKGGAAKTAQCRACSAAIVAGALRCDRCGAMQKDVTCPHCGATAGASPHPQLRYVCDVCGAPRVPVLEGDLKTSGKELPALKRAEAARRGRDGARALAAGSGLLLLLATILFAGVSVVLGVKAVVVIFALLTAASLGMLTVWAAMRAKARGAEIEPAVDAAWVSIATDIAQQRKTPLTATDLAASLHIEEGQAEQLLALLDVNEIVKSELSDDGGLAYSSRVRVDAPPATAPSAEPSAAELAAEEADAASLPNAKTMLADPAAGKR